MPSYKYYTIENIRKGVLWLKMHLEFFFKKSNLLVTFIFDVFTCCILQKNLRNEDEANIENLFCIIES